MGISSNTSNLNFWLVVAVQSLKFWQDSKFSNMIFLVCAILAAQIGPK